MYNKGDASQIFSMFNSKFHGLTQLKEFQVGIEGLESQLGNIQNTEFKFTNGMMATYKTTFAKGVFMLTIGLDVDNKMTELFSLKPYQEEKTLTVDASLVESPVSLNVTDANLFGSIITPKNSIGKIPVVLIIAGNGPTDRNGNLKGMYGANTYFLLSEALGKAGIATLRYDKRAVGKSTSTKKDVNTRFDDHVDHAVALIKMLKNDPRYSKIIILGHSEGSLVGMLAAEKEKVAAYISVSGAGDKADRMYSQAFKTMPVWAKKYDSLGKGLTVKADVTDPMFRPSVQPYLISWFKYNPQTEIKKLNIPVLILQGTIDSLSTVKDAQNLKKAKPNATLVLVNGMNSAVLKQAYANWEHNSKTYLDPNLPINPTLVKTVVQFINELK